MIARIGIVGLLLIISMQVAAFEVLETYRNFKAPTDGKKTWYIFDLDNTLIQPVSAIGSVQWAEAINKKLQQNGMSPEEASQKQHDLFGQAQIFVYPAHMEYEEIALLGSLAKQGNVIALTARNNNLVQITMQQLQKIGIREAFQMNPVVVTVPPKNFIYDQGIIFASGQDKGSILEEILATSEQIPERIVFFDDKDYNVISLEKALERVNQSRANKIEFIGYHYTAANNTIKYFDANKADIEWYGLKYLGKDFPLQSLQLLTSELVSRRAIVENKKFTRYSCTENRVGDLVTKSCELRLCQEWIYLGEGDDVCAKEISSPDKYHFIFEYIPKLNIYIRKGWQLY